MQVLDRYTFGELPLNSGAWKLGWLQEECGPVSAVSATRSGATFFLLITGHTTPYRNSHHRTHSRAYLAGMGTWCWHPSHFLSYPPGGSHRRVLRELSEASKVD